MARCGYCNATGLELENVDGDSLLEPHTMPDTRKRCKRMDNPSLTEVKFQKEMRKGPNEKAIDAMWEREHGSRGAIAQRERADRKSQIRSIDIKRRKDANGGFSF